MTLSQEVDAERADGFLFENMACPNPESWEDYLILAQIEERRFGNLPARFQQAYEDVLQRLRQAGLVAADIFALTSAGQFWKHEFETHFLGV